MIRRSLLHVALIVMLFGSISPAATTPAQAATPTIIASIPLRNTTNLSGIAINSVTNQIYVAGDDYGGISLIDGNTNSVTSILPELFYPRKLAVNPVTNRIYVDTSSNSTAFNSITVIDGVTNTVLTTIPASPRPGTGIAVNSTTNRVYVADMNYNISVVDGNNNSIIGSIYVPNCPRDISVNSTTNRIYVILNDCGGGPGNALLGVIDGETNTVITTIPLGSTEFAVSVTVNPQTNRVYVSNFVEGNIVIIDSTTNAIITTIPVAGNLRGIAVNPTTNNVYITKADIPDQNYIRILDGDTNTITTIPAFGGNYNVAINPTTNRVYVVGGDSNIWVVQDDGETTPPATYTISGRITDGSSNPQPIGGITIQIGLSGRATTNLNGDYIINGLTTGTYILTPVKEGYNFSPRVKTVTISDNNVTGQDFVASLTPTIDYIALGDSVAAGHGLTYYAKTDPGYPCRQSLDKSYPAQLKTILEARGYKVHFKLFACSGATAQKPDWKKLEKEGQRDDHKWLSYQVRDAVQLLSSSEHQPGTKVLVTISIGANDFPWTDPVGLCDALNSGTRTLFERSVARTLHAITNELLPQVSKLLKTTPDVAVVIAEYPNPFNQKSILFRALRNDFGCTGAGLGGSLSEEEMYRRTEYIVEQLNLALATDVVYALNKKGSMVYGRVGFAGGIRNKFIGHEAPGNQRPSDGKGECGFTVLPSIEPSQIGNYTWIQYPSDLESFSYPGDQVIPLAKYSVVSDAMNWHGDCFHPNRTGEFEIAKSVNEAALLVAR